MMRFQKGHTPWNKGNHLSERHCRRLSEVLKGRNRSEEHRRNLSESLKGRKFSEETRRKLSEARKGRHHSEESRRRISEAMKGERNPNYGRHPSEETRRKMSEARRGRPLSEETCRKLSEARFRRKRDFGYLNSPEARRKMSLAHRGENNHNWKGGYYEPYYGPDWQYQRRLARERDDYTCICGLEEDGREHDVHHIVPYRISKDNSQNNLWTLCPKCHRRIEAITGEDT